MEPSHFYVDTVIKSGLKITGKIVFHYLDSLYTDTLQIREYFAKKYNDILQDKSEFLFVANLTNKPISFKKLNDHLVAEEFGVHENFGYQPINFFLYPRCGTGINYDDLVLLPREILIIKNLISRNTVHSSSPRNCFLKLLTKTGILISTPFRKALVRDNFYINSAFENYFNYGKPRLAFANK